MSTIYLIESIMDYDVCYKIGYTKSNSSKNRIKNLQTGNNGDLKIIYEFHTNYGTLLEKTLHKYFKPKHKKGEWFQLDLKDILDFPSICNRFENNFDLLKENTYFNKNLNNF